MNAVRFMHAALRRDAAHRPSADELLRHAWLTGAQDPAARGASSQGSGRLGDGYSQVQSEWVQRPPAPREAIGVDGRRAEPGGGLPGAPAAAADGSSGGGGGGGGGGNDEPSQALGAPSLVEHQRHDPQRFISRLPPPRRMTFPLVALDRILREQQRRVRREQIS